MNYDRRKDLFALIGVISIIGALLFIGLQLKLSNELEQAAQHQARAAHTMSLYAGTIQSELDWSTRLEDDGERSRAEIVANQNIDLWAWTAIENQYYQYERGFLSEEDWSAAENRIKEMLETSTGRASYDYVRLHMRASFVDAVDSLAENLN